MQSPAFGPCPVSAQLLRAPGSLGLLMVVMTQNVNHRDVRACSEVSGVKDFCVFVFFCFFFYGMIHGFA